MSKIIKVAHLSDIHIRRENTRNEEYEQVFENLYVSLREYKPDRIHIGGDLVHDNLNLTPSQILVANKFLTELAKIAPVRTTRGNHDIMKANPNKTDSVAGIIGTLETKNVVYYNKTGFYVDENIVWCVWHHRDTENKNPWKLKEAKDFKNSYPDHTFIDLFHDPIGGCSTSSGFEMNSSSYVKVSDFEGHMLMAGDIHLMQYLNKEKTKAYSGSLISQDFSEGGKFHGYLLWNIEERKAKEIAIHNDHSFQTIKLTPYVDFDDLDFEIENPTKFMKVRFVWNTLPQSRTKENEKKLESYVWVKYENTTISHKNDFIQNDKIDVGSDVTLENIQQKDVQHEIFKDYLVKIGVDDRLLNDVISLDNEITDTINIVDDISTEWNIIKFGGSNFMSYEQLDIDWRNMDGVFQISGKNVAGKTTIIKLLAYIHFGKTPETETRVKHGDSRFVNNRNGAEKCLGYSVIEANGEYFGTKRTTTIKKDKDGAINGASTALSYYLLSSPDDEMNDNTLLDKSEKLNENERAKTQKKIESIIGTYENFNRIVSTSANSLNRILSNDMATFIDSLLNDSGLDIFDKKLDGLKAYEKRLNEKHRISCNVGATTTENIKFQDEIEAVNLEINEIETVALPKVQSSILKGRAYVEELTKKLFKIDPEIYTLSVSTVKEGIGKHNANIVNIKAREGVINENIIPLKETYDVEKLNTLNEKKDAHKTNEYNLKTKIRDFERVKVEEEHRIEIINGDIFRLNKDIVQYENEIKTLKESKTCPTCKQKLLPEQQYVLDEGIVKIETKISDARETISLKMNKDIVSHKNNITAQIEKIELVKKEIIDLGFEMEGILKEIGVLTNDKNDVEKRKEFQNELDQIPMKIQNEELKISILQQKLDNYENSLVQIEENQKTNKTIGLSKDRITLLEGEEQVEKENIFTKKNLITQKLEKIKSNNKLMNEFKEQEYRDSVVNLYKKCVHRDGIPRQMLTTYIIPKINSTLGNILSIAPFKIWLDLDDLKPKLVYNDRPISIIDCISASGKERTFSSIVLKFALNQINVKAKPSIFLLDEVMGMLDDESSEEFVEILQLIKKSMKKILIVEHVREINPDYVISVSLDENGISSLSLN